MCGTSLFLLHSGLLLKVVEPIGGTVGKPASIFCQFLIQTGTGTSIILRDGVTRTVLNPSKRFRLGMVNTTHKEYIVTEVRKTDAGWTVLCAVSEIFSSPATFRVPCKT